MTIRSLDSLFNPSAIALVGASKRPGSIGWVLARNLMSAGFDGPIMPVNPKHRSVGGVLAWPNVAALPVVPDLAIVSTPPDVVPGVVAELRDKGCKAVVVIAAGFGEDGDPGGLERAEALKRAAGDMRILGPNKACRNTYPLRGAFNRRIPVSQGAAGDKYVVANPGPVALWT